MKRIVIIAGPEGSGKSMSAMDVEEPIEFLDIENKSEDLQNKYFSDKLINRQDILVFDDKFNEDWYATYLLLKEKVDDIVERGRQVKNGKLDYIGFESLVIDGISPIRKKLMLAKWLYDHSKKVTGKYSRKKPNEFEWADINKDTRELLFPLINMVISGIFPTLIFTAEMTPNYELIDVFDESTNKITKKSVKNGFVPDYKEFMGYKVLTLLELSYDKKLKKYGVACTKSLIGGWEEDVTGRSVFDVLLSRGL